MKKISILILGLFLCVAGSRLMAQPAHDQYVGQTSQSFATQYGSWTTTNPVLYTDCADDEEFYISRVRLKDRFVNANTQVDQSLDPDRKLLWWCPVGHEHWNGLPSYHFDEEVFTMWSYMDIWGNWTAPFVRMPAAFMDACHKNGVRTSVLASIPYGIAVGTSQDPHGKNIHALYSGGTAKFLQFLRYYGIDGIGFNSEFNGDATIISELKSMLGNAFAQKDNYNWPQFTNAWYGFMNNSGSTSDGSQLYSSNVDWFHYNGNPTSDAFFLNYNWGSSYLATSQATATGKGRSSYDVYAGMDFQGRNYAQWPALKNYKISVGLWGAHSTNMIFGSRLEKGESPAIAQATYQLISENVFTGSSYNPVNTPEISTLLAHSSNTTDFHGFSSFITARSTLITDDLAAEPFVTYFNVGNGTFFNVQGERQFDGEWYNIGIQDYMPTWRWWWTSTWMGRTASDVPATGLKAAFTWEDAWFGGSCLSISGQTDSEYLHLFKTEYPLKTNDVITIRYKVLSGSGTLAWAYAAKDAEATGLTTAIGTVSAADEPEWVEKTINVRTAGNAYFRMGNKTLAILGLQFTNTTSDFEMLIGEISIKRGSSATPAKPTIVKGSAIDVTYQGVAFKLIYKMKDRNGVEPIYNDEVGTWYYKIYYQQEGEEPVLCTATTSWAAYMVGAPINMSGTQRYRLGVSAVSLDGNSDSEIAWTDYMAYPTFRIVETISIDKPIVKPNETFTVGYDDPNHAAATWKIYNTSGVQQGSTYTGKTFTASLPSVGMYNLEYTCNGTTLTNAGYIQISPEGVGAMPEVYTFTADKNEADVNEAVTYTYTGRNADGTASRGLQLESHAFAVPSAGLVSSGSDEFSVCFWIYFNKFNHLGSGTNLFSIMSPESGWPATQWGYIWCDIGADDNMVLTFRSTSNIGCNQTRFYCPFGTGRWYHVAFVIGNTTGGRYINMYVNGQHITGNGTGGYTHGPHNNVFSWYADNYIRVSGLAGGNADLRAGIDGILDAFQIYDKALSATEVKASMDDTYSKTSSNLIGYWDFETDNNEDGSMTSTGYNKTAKAYLMDNEYGEQGTPDVYWTPTYTSACPFIAGNSYKVETLPIWEFVKGSNIASATGNTSAGSASVSYPTPGTYTAKLSLSNSWGTSAPKTIDVVVVGQEPEPGTAVEEVSAVETSVYPNPFVNEVHVGFAEAGRYAIQVYDLSGKMVSNHAVTAAGGEIINVAINATPGSYIVRILNEAGNTVKSLKLIKQ